MNWSVEFLEEAKRDMKRLDHSAQIQVLKGIRKVAGNPVSIHEGGYGKPLGHHNDNDLTGPVQDQIPRSRASRRLQDGNG